MRTPDERFERLPGFSFPPHYREWRGLRAHYLDEGRGDATFLCLHGEPTWSYLYRRMVPAFTASGARVVAPDFIGFGRSDKPEEESAYSFEFHRDFLLDFVEAMDLRNITLVVQDWGGLLGLTLPMEAPERYAGLLLMNTTLACADAPLPTGFLAWRSYANANPDLACGKLLARSCPHLSAAEAAAYDAPFPDARAKAGVRRFPNLVPEQAGDSGAALSRKARDFLRNTWKGASFMAIGEKDPVLGVPVMQDLRKNVRGCGEPYVVAQGGHFLQEWGEEVARAALAHWERA